MSKLKQWLNKHADEAKLSYNKFDYILLVTHFKGYMIFSIVLYILSCLLWYIASFFSDYGYLWLFGVAPLTMFYAVFLLIIFLSKIIGFKNKISAGVEDGFPPLFGILAINIFPILEIIYPL